MEIYKGGCEEWDGGGGYGQEKMSQGPGLGRWRKGTKENGERGSGKMGSHFGQVACPSSKALGWYRWYAEKAGSNLLQLSFLSKVCGLWTGSDCDFVTPQCVNEHNIKLWTGSDRDFVPPQ